MKIIDNGRDSVFIGPRADKIELRIGESKRGQSGVSYLAPADAKILAYALLAEVERSTRRGKLN